MKTLPFAILALAALLAEASAPTNSCSIQVTGAADDWKFIQVYDLAKGKVVLSQAVRTGDTKEVTVEGDQVRVDWKLPGDEHYKAGAATVCKGGNVIEV